MPEQRDSEHFRDVPDQGTIRTRMRRRGAVVVAFTVQFKVWTDGAWRPAVRYDAAHGHAHRDILDWDGRVIDKLWLSARLSLNEALTTGERDLIANAATYREDFLRRKP